MSEDHAIELPHDPPYRVGTSSVAWTIDGALEQRKRVAEAFGVRANIFDRDTGDLVTKGNVERYRQRDKMLGEPTEEQKQAWLDSRSKGSPPGS